LEEEMKEGWRRSLTNGRQTPEYSALKIEGTQAMYAIIDEGGRQHMITPGVILEIDREVGIKETTITFDRVLLVGGEGEPKIGLPLVAGATVTADVIGPVKGPKIDIQKYKRRKGYHKKQGHRQKYVSVKITGINV